MQTVSLKEASAVAATGFVPRVSKAVLIVAPALLKCALFRACTGPRAQYTMETLLSGHSTAQVYYTGEELRQDDLRVLLALVKAAEGTRAEAALELHMRSFATEMGKADSSTSVASLKASLKRLQQARIRVVAAAFEGYYSLVSSVEFTPASCTVSLSRKALELLGSGTLTALDRDTRFGQKDGFASWLYGLVRSDACLAPFNMEKLQAWSGLESYESKEFTRLVRKTLAGFVEAETIESFKLEKGSLRIRKGG